MFGKNRSNSAHTSKHSPTYDLSDKGLYTTLVIGGSMMILTIAGMLLTADTVISEYISVIYQYPIVGVFVIGGFLTAGRYLGMRGVSNDNIPMALIGSGLLIFTYSWLGGGMLTPYSSELYTPAIVISGIITIAISLLASAYVYSTDKNLEHWRNYSAYAFMGVFGTALVGTFLPPILIASFFLGFIGFLADLVYEIWMTSNENRSAYANGIALYVAFAGVFVHVLRMVLEVLGNQ